MQSLSTRRPRTLVCVVGQLRATQRTWNSFQRHVLEPLQAEFVICADPPGPADADCPFRRNAKLTWNAAVPTSLDEEFDRIQADLIGPDAPRPDWRAALRRRGLWCGGLPGRPGAGAISFYKRWQLCRHLRETGLTGAYDRFVITRSDFLWRADHPPLERLHPDRIWVPDGEDHGGLNDRHAVLSPALLEAGLDLLTPLLTQPAFIAPSPGEDAEWNIESYLRECLRRRGLESQVRRFPYVMLLIREADGPTLHAWGAWEEELQCFVKWRTEQFASEAVTALLGSLGGWEGVLAQPICDEDVAVHAELWGVNAPHRLWRRSRWDAPSPTPQSLIRTGLYVRVRTDRLEPVAGQGESSPASTFTLTLATPGERPHLRYRPVYRLQQAGLCCSWNRAGKIQLTPPPPVGWRRVLHLTIQALTGFRRRNLFALTPLGGRPTA